MKYILASHAILPESSGQDLVCMNLEQHQLVKQLRRAGQMTRLASIGAYGCLEQSDGIPLEQLGIFHGTAFGNLQETRTVFLQTQSEPEELPSPIKFSCSLSNISSFFIAMITGAQGINQLISQDDFSFEAALYASQISAAMNEVNYALVGATDRFFGTREEHVKALRYPSTTQFGEGTGWFVLSKTASNAIGEIVLVEPFVQGNTEESWNFIFERVFEYRHNNEPVWIVPGLRTKESELTKFLQYISGSRIKHYLNRTGIYPTAAACGLVDLVSKGQTGLYVHVATNNFGQKALLIIRI